MIDEILQFNKRFVERREYERFITDKYPNKRIAIVTCMDTRLVELLPAALGLKNGDVKIIKNAGATITSPFDSTVRSLLVAIYELGVTEIMIIGHTECGVQGMDSAQMQHLMKERGIPEQHSIAASTSTAGCTASTTRPRPCSKPSIWCAIIPSCRATWWSRAI